MIPSVVGATKLGAISPNRNAIVVPFSCPTFPDYLRPATLAFHIVASLRVLSSFLWTAEGQARGTALQIRWPQRSRPEIPTIARLQQGQERRQRDQCLGR